MDHDARLSVIALHGLALSHQEIDGMAAPMLQHLGCAGIRWVFPKAPRRPVTILGGRPALAWYDILARDRSQMDEGGIEEATAAIRRAVQEERERGLPGRRIVLVGFSQGGCLALHAGLQLQEEVDGIVALATALPFPDRVPEATPQSPPIFFGHGLFDTIIPHSLGRESCRLLAARGYSTQWRSYVCGHWITRRLLGDVSRRLHGHMTDGGSRERAAPALESACALAPSASR